MLASQQDAPITMLETAAPIKEVSSASFPGRAREVGSYETSCSTGVRVNPSCSACRRRKRSFLARFCSGLPNAAIPISKLIVTISRDITFRTTNREEPLCLSCANVTISIDLAEGER